MDLQKYFPTLEDFRNQVTTFHFSSDDLDFQKRMAFKAGYQSWEDYLDFIFYLSTNIYDIEALSNELGHDFIKTNMITGSLPILLNKHLNISLKEEMQPIFAAVANFPIDDQDRIGIFENKLIILFTSLMLNKRKDDPIALELVEAFQKDTKSQFLAINSPLTLENTSSIAESILMPNTNSVIQKYTIPNFYFPSQKHLLKKLYEILLAEGLIKANDDFEQTFEKKVKPSNLKATLWLADTTELFYLLYRLNNNKEYADEGISIDKIANQLFTFNKTKTDNAIRTGFVKAFKQFEEEEYLNKKMSTITHVLQKLSI